MSAPDPDFDLLPEDPFAFFGLELEFEPRELKRRYTRLIKRYKPDRDPDAFKQIRAAYEALSEPASPSFFAALARAEVKAERDEELEDDDEDDARELAQSEARSPGKAPRFGPPFFNRGHGASADLDPEADEDEDEDEDGEDEPFEPPASALSLIARCKREGAARAYELLRAKQPKEPEDYPRLAVLSDLHPDPQRSFLDWLLEGLRRYPDEPALEHHLLALCRDGLPPDERAQALERLATSLSPGRFYVASLPIWLRFLREAPFAEVEELLLRCETLTRRTGLIDLASLPRLLFTLRFLRAAVWSAPEAWIRERVAFLGQHHARLPDGLDAELDFLELIQDYFAQRSRFLEAGRPAQLVDQCLRAYCELPESELDPFFLASQRELAAYGDDLLWTFGPGDEHAALALAALGWVARDVDSRRFADTPALSRGQVLAELRRVERPYRNDPRWDVYNNLAYHLPFVGLVALPLLCAALFSALSTPFSPVVLLLVLFAITVSTKSGSGDSPVQRARASLRARAQSKQSQLSDRLYLRKLRPALCAFMLSTQLRAPIVASMIEDLCEPRELWSWDPAWLAMLVRSDPGLGLLSLTSRFVRV